MRLPEQAARGEFGILPGHVPFVTTLKIGMLIAKAGKESKYFFVNWGYAEIGADKVMVLADSAERSEEIDLERAKEAMKRAEERLKNARTAISTGQRHRWRGQPQGFR